MDNPDNNVSFLSPPNKDICVTQIKESSQLSGNLDIWIDVYERMLEYEYTIPQIMKLFSEGEYTRIEQEKGNLDGIGFTVVFKLAGELEGCHIRGWFDRTTGFLHLSDMFKCVSPVT